jgi:hypothetical protein
MILRVRGGHITADRAWIHAYYGISPETVRKHWTPIGYDHTTRAALYDIDPDQADQLRRKRRTRPKSTITT